MSAASHPLPVQLMSVQFETPSGDLLDRLDEDQRRAATAPPGPMLCIAPAGSGKTTTLVARLVWLVAGARPAERARPGALCAVTFNRRAAEELAARIAAALAPLGLAPDAVRVRTFHALARETLLDAGVSVERLVDRPALLAELFPNLELEERQRLDDAFGRLKLEHDVTAEDVARDPDPPPLGRAFLRYEGALADLGGLDFDDLVAKARRLLEAEPALLDRWRRRCGDLLVDEVQDVDRAQLRLALLLAAPRNRVFFVGDDDQTIYAWRLADVRRVLDLPRRLPGLSRVDLTTNYRCPAVVVERAVRLIEGNRERFAKRIRARPGAAGRLVLAPIDDPSSDAAAVVERLLDRWPGDGRSQAILARTNQELLPAAAALLERDIPFRSSSLASPLLDPNIEPLLEAIEASDPRLPLLRRIAAAATGVAAREGARIPAGTGSHGEGAGGGRAGKECGRRDAEGPPAAEGRPDVGLGVRGPIGGDEVTAGVAFHEAFEPAASPTGDRPGGSSESIVAAVLAWAARFPPNGAEAFLAAVRERRARLRTLVRDDAALVLSTVHGAKGLEFDDVAVLGLNADAFPNGRSVASALEPERALEEERRLAYVAWTRARRSLTLVFDPRRPSPFLVETFDQRELGLGERGPPRAAAPVGRTRGAVAGDSPRV